MKKIVYYVATSIDGFIAGPNDETSGFTAAGDGVSKYLEDLKGFKTVIMGRRTYEFGYKYGLEPGLPAYPNMQHYIFSKTLRFENQSRQITLCDMNLEIIKDLKTKSESDIYLCGGGIFAGWLLENEMIDVLKIKLNPLIMGNGIPLFGTSPKKYLLKLIQNEVFDDGMSIISYQIKYS